jgi:uncharacterized membrane protein
MITRHVRCAIAIAALGVLSTGSSALADFRVCNKAPFKIAVALGWNDPTSGWSSRGWWNLAPGACESVFSGPVQSRVFYVYATGANGSAWAPRDRAQPGGAFCIDPQLKYLTRNRDYGAGNSMINCEAAGLVGRKFDQVNTGQGANWTYMLGIGGDPSPQPAPVHTTPAPSPVPNPGPAPGGTACQRYPNLC